MKVVCIKQDRNKKISLNKVYIAYYINEVLSQLNYYIEDDFGDKSLYDKRLFMTLDEWRDKKISEIID
jgi:hypothetical protein